VSAADFAPADETLRTAALLLVPEDQTQRQAFEKLMPNLYVLRSKGFSWAQITKLLNECGLHLQPSTVRTYYSEMLAARMDICQARMNEQIAVMAAVRSETAGMDLPAVSGRVQAFIQLQQQTALAKVDALSPPATQSKSVEATPHRRAIPAPSPLPTRRPSESPTSASTCQASQNAKNCDAEDDNVPSGEFGLLRLSGSSQQSQGGPAGFFTLGVEPAAPARSAAPPERQPGRRQVQAPAQTASVSPQRAPANITHTSVATQSAAKKRVGPLQEGVPALKRRDNVPDRVYEPGDLEHPAIPGLMLSLEQRLYGASLEYLEVDSDKAGAIKVETPDEKRFRVVWRQTVPITPTRTAASFTKMDPSLFSPQF